MKFEKYRTKLYLLLVMFVCINCLTIGNVFSEDMRVPDNTAVSVSERSSKTIEQKAIYIWRLELWSIDGHVVTIKKVVSSVLILFLGIFVIKFMNWLIKKRLSAHPSINENTAFLIQKISYYFLVVFVLLFALRTLNVPLTAFTFLGGALAIGVGFGTQTIMNNFIKSS
jgi:potassium efflux system protein